jgi:hypothetical protein
MSKIEKHSKMKSKDGLKIKHEHDDFATSTILLKIFLETYIFSPWSFKHATQKE